MIATETVGELEFLRKVSQPHNRGDRPCRFWFSSNLSLVPAASANANETYQQSITARVTQDSSPVTSIVTKRWVTENSRVMLPVSGVGLSYAGFAWWFVLTHIELDGIRTRSVEECPTEPRLTRRPVGIHAAIAASAGNLAALVTPHSILSSFKSRSNAWAQFKPIKFLAC